MVLNSVPVTTFAGIIIPKKSWDVPKLTVSRLLEYRKSHLVSVRNIFKTRPRYFIREEYGAKYVNSVGRNHHELSLHNDVQKEPFWVAPAKEIIGGLKSLIAFLAEQPSQLKYIEWPGFQNTLKTAVLTLVLVAMLIVVLSSVDSGLWYLLALILRKPV